MNNDVIFRVIFTFIFIFFITMRVYYGRKARSVKIEETKEPIGKLRIIFGLIAAGSFFAIVIIYIIYPEVISGFNISLPIWLRWIGVGISICSLLFWLWVHHTLGQFWSSSLELKKQHQLVTNGPYSKIRHPMYTAIFAFMIANSLITANWLFVFCCVVSIIVLSIRITKEEEMMIEKFGEEYIEYKKHTGRLLPRLKKSK